MELMRYFWGAAVVLDPAAYELDEGRRLPICRTKLLAGLFAQAGLHATEVRSIDVPAHFRGFDNYCSPFSADRIQRSGTPYRSMKYTKAPSAIGFDPICPLGKTARSI
jgi:hypothetical protein